MAGSKVRASGSVLQRDAGVAAIARFLHKARAEGVHGRGGIGSEKGLSGRGYVNGGRVASPPPATSSRYIAPQPSHDGGGWTLVKVVVARRCNRGAQPSFTIGNVYNVHARAIKNASTTGGCLKIKLSIGRQDIRIGLY